MLDKANQTSFKKGQKAWNKGKSGKESLGNANIYRKCRKCEKVFQVFVLAQRYCSPQCGIRIKKCLFCGEDFNAYFPHLKYCSTKCSGKHSETLRMGKNNPAYRNGFSVRGNKTYTGLHLSACAKYRKTFYERVDYPYCEVCGVNEMGTPKFEVHHIYFASLYPKHPNLHDFRNLVHICIKCHNLFHGMKLPEAFKKLEKERGLKELFAKRSAG